MIGHIAIIVDVQNDHVDIVEQNVEDAIWPPGQKYSRRLKAKTDSNGKFSILPDYSDTEVLGWMNIDYSATIPKERKYQCTNKSLAKHVFAVKDCDAPVEWLDKNDPAVKVWAEMHGDRLVEAGGKSATYFSLTESGHLGLQQATDELHRMFLNATEQVVYNEELLSKFQIPKKLYQRIRKSWQFRHNDYVSGRFDFSLTPQGVKVYEYNADSASCLLECGYIQDKWANAIGIGNIGREGNTELFDDLVETWKKRKVVGVLHLLHDKDLEETYHTLYMKSAAEKAGIVCKTISGVDGLSWTTDGQVQDADGVTIKNVWKTWSWLTAFGQLSDEELNDKIEGDLTLDKSKPPRLVDILLNPAVRVFEPLWTVIPANKAILPILWKLYPQHPLLLDSSFEITEKYKKNGYVTKPISGRTGKNVVIYSPSGNVIEKTDGRWQNDISVYQELCLLPDYDGDKVQVCTFAVSGSYGGTVLRVDKSNIIGLDSSVYCLRIIPDKEN